MNEQKSPPPPGFSDPPPPYQATCDGVAFQPELATADQASATHTFATVPLPAASRRHDTSGAPWGVPGYAPPAGFDGVGAPMGQPMAPPGQWPPGATTARVTVVNMAQAGPYPVQLICPNCGAHVLTSTSYRPGLLTWLLSGALVLLGCWMGCCLIPCCVPECHDVDHHCPSCKHHLCTYRRL